MTGDALAVALAAALAGFLAAPLAAADLVLPESAGDWRAAGSDATYTPETLHEYIDGGAELYLSYGFRRLTSRRFTRADGSEPEITLDVFELRHSEDAFGLFAHGREGTPDDALPPGVGQDALQIGGLLSFWKGRTYVSILAYPETPEALAVLPVLARAVSDAIPERGRRPALLAALPEEALDPASVRFFRHPLWLNSYGYISNDNVLDLAPDCAAVMGRYRTGTGVSTLAVVDYPTSERAARAEEHFRAAVLARDAGETVRMSEGRWAGIRRADNRLAVVLDAPEESRVRSLLDGPLDAPAHDTGRQEAP
jgi:hypothetical protein